MREGYHVNFISAVTAQFRISIPYKPFQLAMRIKNLCSKVFWGREAQFRQT